MLRISNENFRFTVTVDSEDRDTHYYTAYWWTEKGKTALEFLITEYYGQNIYGVNMLESTVDSRDTLEIATRLLEA